MKEIGRDTIAGLCYGDYQKCKNIKAGDKLELWHERHNPVDTRAIKITLRGIKLGYVKAGSDLQSRLHNLKNSGIKCHASIVSFNKNNPSWSMIVFRVEANIEEEKNCIKF
jgi:hypothetical protein